MTKQAAATFEESSPAPIDKTAIAVLKGKSCDLVIVTKQASYVKWISCNRPHQCRFSSHHSSLNYCPQSHTRICPGISRVCTTHNRHTDQRPAKPHPGTIDAVPGMWVTDFAKGILKLAVSHFARCTFNKDHPSPMLSSKGYSTVVLVRVAEDLRLSNRNQIDSFC